MKEPLKIYYKVIDQKGKGYCCTDWDRLMTYINKSKTITMCSFQGQSYGKLGKVIK